MARASKDTRHKEVWLQHRALVEDDKVSSVSCKQTDCCSNPNKTVLTTVYAHNIVCRSRHDGVVDESVVSGKIHLGKMTSIGVHRYLLVSVHRGF